MGRWAASSSPVSMALMLASTDLAVLLPRDGLKSASASRRSPTTNPSMRDDAILCGSQKKSADGLDHRPFHRDVPLGDRSGRLI